MRSFALSAVKPVLRAQLIHADQSGEGREPGVLVGACERGAVVGAAGAVVGHILDRIARLARPRGNPIFALAVSTSFGVIWSISLGKRRVLSAVGAMGGPKGGEGRTAV